MNIARSSFEMFLGRAGSALIVFLGIAYFARALDATQLGILFLFQALLGFITVPTDLGVRGALEKRISEGQDSRTILSTAIVFKTALLLPVSLLLVFGSPHINAYLGGTLTLYLVVALVTQEYAEIFIQTIRGELRIGTSALLMFAQKFAWIGISVIVVALGYGVTEIILSLIASHIVALVGAFAATDVRLGSPSRESFESLFDYSRYHFISDIGTKAYEWMDVAIIGYFLTASLVGAYQLAWQVTMLVALVSGSIATTLFPQMSQWSTGGEETRHKIESVVWTGVAVAIFVSIPAFFGALLFSSEILDLIFGSEYVVASAVMVVLMFEKIFQSTNDILVNALRALNRPDFVTIALAVTVPLNFVLNVVLILQIGILGVAIATAASWVVNTVLHIAFLSRLITLRLPYELVPWCCASAGGMALVLAGLKLNLSIDSIPVLSVVICFGVLIYMLLGAIVPTTRKHVILPAVRHVL